MLVRKDVEEWGPPYTGDRGHSGKEFGSSFQNQKMHLPYDPAIAFLGIYLKEMTYFHPEAGTQMS